MRLLHCCHPELLALRDYFLYIFFLLFLWIKPRNLACDRHAHTVLPLCHLSFSVPCLQISFVVSKYFKCVVVVVVVILLVTSLSGSSKVCIAHHNVPLISWLKTSHSTLSSISTPILPDKLLSVCCRTALTACLSAGWCLCRACCLSFLSLFLHFSLSFWGLFVNRPRERGIRSQWSVFTAHHRET